MSQSRSDVHADQAPEGGRTNRIAWILVGSGMAFLVAAGLLLWWRYGAAVFSDVVVAALAWCF